MKYLELTLPQPAANIALDEALIESAEAGQCKCELLRIWEPAAAMVVIGRSSRWQREVHMDECRQADIPVFRRCSGGAAILTGPGCLMYAVLLSYERRPALRQLNRAHQFVMTTIQRAIERTGTRTEFEGTCDLTYRGRKVSGNSLRCKRSWLLYHGTLICQTMDLRLIEACLGQPARQPVYRRGRSHREFVGRLPATTAQMADALRETWPCDGVMSSWPEPLTQRLVHEKYSRDSWNLRI